MTVTVANLHRLPDDWASDSRYVYIGRPGHGMAGPFGNPFTGPRQAVLTKYRRWLREKLDSDPAYATRFWAIPADAVLVCFCAPRACHGDYMAYLLNRHLTAPADSLL